MNPYTGLALSKDPALAMVETNNENGLIHTWLSGNFDCLPEPFAGDLKRQWNAWLAKRYKDTAALSAAWDALFYYTWSHEARDFQIVQALRLQKYATPNSSLITPPSGVDSTELNRTPAAPFYAFHLHLRV